MHRGAILDTARIHQRAILDKARMHQGAILAVQGSLSWGAILGLDKIGWSDVTNESMQKSLPLVCEISVYVVDKMSSAKSNQEIL